MFRLTEPSNREIERFLDEAATKLLSYSEIGIASEAAPAGYQLDTAEVVLGRGRATFERAAAAMQAWTMFDLGWMTLKPSSSTIEPGVNVAVVVSHLGFWSLNGCRVVYMLETDSSRFGFAYCTLNDHAEQGEEVFEVSLDSDTGAVVYRIRAASRPRALLVKLGYPYARRLQARFRADSGRRMQQATL